MKKNIKKTKILITGGLGFIGSYLVEFLLEKKKYSITILDDLSTGSLKNLSSDSRKSKNIVIYKTNINTFPKLKSCIKNNDIIIHLAASVGVKKIVYDSLNSIINNMTSTEKIIKYCSKYKKKVMFASTSEVYGKINTGNKTLKETSDVKYGSSEKLRWSYAVGKFFDEFYIKAYQEKKKLNAIILRFFNIVGKGQIANYGMVLPNFVNNAKKNKNLLVHGTGKQTRNFTCVKEATKVLYLLMNSKKAWNETYNIGSKNEISIDDLAKKVIKITSSKSKIKKIPYKKVYNNNFEDMEKRSPNIDKLKKIIKYYPKKNIDKIIKEIAN